MEIVQPRWQTVQSRGAAMRSQSAAHPTCERCGSYPCCCEERYGHKLWRCRSYICWLARFFQERYPPFDFDGAINAGLLVAVQALRDGEIADARLSKRAKRWVAREMINVIRATSPGSSQPPIPDYGYEDGRRVREFVTRPPKDKFARYRQRQRAAGLCPRCGQKPEEYVLCNRCRENRRRSYRRRVERMMANTS